MTHRARPRLKDGFPGLWKDWPPGPTPPSPKPSSSFDPLRLYPAHCIQRAIDLRISKCTRASDSVLGQGQGWGCGDQGVQKAGGESRRRWRDDVLVSFAPVWPKAGPGCPPIGSCGAGLCDERKDGALWEDAGLGRLSSSLACPCPRDQGFPVARGLWVSYSHFLDRGRGCSRPVPIHGPESSCLAGQLPARLFFSFFFEMLKVRGEK